jgi:hypothetical protein
MKKADVIRGRIERHGKGLGTVDEDLVRQRAREIAVTNGRQPEQFNQSDWEEARLELLATQGGPPETVEEEGAQVAPREGPFGVSTGTTARKRVPSDEQMYPDQLVAEGVEEADHERMVEGNRESRKRDANFDDQLPAAE